MKISIITVVYNTGDKLVGTLDSVCSQEYQDYEVVIVDGCSKDKTLDIVNSYQGKFADLIILSEPDKGIYDAMNKGVHLAKGDYVYFLNAGDLLYDKEVLSNVATNLNGENVVYGNAITKDKTGKAVAYREGEFSKYRLAYTNICHQTIFYPRDTLLLHPYNLRYHLFADWELNMWLWKRKPFTFIDTSIVLYEGGGASDVQKDMTFKKDNKRLILKYLGIDAIMFLIIRKMFRWK